MGFKCSRQKLQELLKEEDIGKEGVVDFRNLLQLVNRLQGDSYDLYDEIQQVSNWATFNTMISLSLPLPSSLGIPLDRLRQRWSTFSKWHSQHMQNCGLKVNKAYTNIVSFLNQMVWEWDLTIIILCRLSTADIEGMIEEADQNGDGLISLEEFIDTMKRTALFNN